MMRIRDLPEKYVQGIGEIPWDSWVAIDCNDQYPYRIRLTQLAMIIAQYTIQNHIPSASEAVMRKVTERIACLEAELAAEKAKHGRPN